MVDDFRSAEDIIFANISGWCFWSTDDDLALLQSVWKYHRYGTTLPLR